MWLTSSFKQLSNVQGRQVGALIGACIADAAVAPFYSAGNRLPEIPHFQPTSPFGNLTLEVRKQYGMHQHSVHIDGLLCTLRALEAERGVFRFDTFQREVFSLPHRPQEQLTPAWRDLVEIRKGNKLNHRETVPEVLDDTDALTSAIPLVTLYPWVDDQGLDVVLRHVWELFDIRGVRCASYPYFQALCRILVRYLQNNPDPVRNTRLQLNTGVQDVLKQIETCDSLSTKVENFDRDELKKDGSESACLAALTTLSLPIVRQSSSFSHGIRTLLSINSRESKDIRPAAIFLGALLGAKYGAKALPSSWINATYGLERTIGLSIAMSQYAWNPDYISAGVLPCVDEEGGPFPPETRFIHNDTLID